MIKLDGNIKAVDLMRQIIGKRIDTPLFIGEDALNTCIEFSGGCIRQLFQVVHTSLKRSLGKKIEMAHVRSAIDELGKYLWEYLDNEHLKVLKEGDYRFASSYHQIGRIFEEQGKGGDALRNYQEALEWAKKTGNENQLGGTYHQIGMVFEKQKRWEEALKNYQQALEWYQSTGNEPEMAGSYHQMGYVEESRGEFEKALAYYNKAVEIASQYDHPDLPTTQRSLERIRQKLSDQNSPNT